MSEGTTIGDYNFGFDSAEEFARFREAAWQTVQAEHSGRANLLVTPYALADALFDTMTNYASGGEVSVGMFTDLIFDVIGNLREQGDAE